MLHSARTEKKTLFITITTRDDGILAITNKDGEKIHRFKTLFLTGMLHDGVTQNLNIFLIRIDF